MAIFLTPLAAAALAVGSPAAVPTFVSSLLQEPVETVQDETPAEAPKSEIPPCVGEEIVLESGLKYCVLKEGGEGGSPGFGDRVKVHYTGWNLDGSRFDTSREARQPGMPVEPAEFFVGQVIEGWNEALQLMSPGDQWRVHIPSALAYGETGSPPAIAPNADLIFEIEMLEISARAPKHIPWDDAAANITKLESGAMYRVLSEGTGIAISEADQGSVGFGVFNPTGDVVFAHTMQGRGDKMVVMPSRVPLPFMNDIMPLMKSGAQIQMKIPAKLGLASRGAVPNMPEGADELWLFDVEKVQKFTKPEFMLPPDEELITTESGLKYKIIREGTGVQPTAANTVNAHYAGWLTDGNGFDNSYDRGAPSEFPLRGVVAGWTEGLQLIKEGGAILLVVPSDLGYGAGGRPPKIPGGATLVFYVELVNVR